MIIRIQKAVPLEAYRLRLTFNTKEEGIFDMRPWVQWPAFNYDRLSRDGMKQMYLLRHSDLRYVTSYN